MPYEFDQYACQAHKPLSLRRYMFVKREKITTCNIIPQSRTAANKNSPYSRQNIFSGEKRGDFLLFAGIFPHFCYPP